VGEIAGAGDAATGFEVGDRVAVSWLSPCGNCYFCKRESFNLCENKRAGESKGGFAELGVASKRHLHKMPEGLSFVSATLAEPLACCLNGQDNSRIRAGDIVAIVGAGPIGLLHLQAAKAKGAQVISCDLLAERLETARRVGADHLVDSSQGDPVQAVLDLTGGRGANAVIVAVGSPQAILPAIRMAALKGTVNLFAGTYPPATIDLDPNLIHYRELALCGSWDYTPKHFRNALELLGTGTVATEPLISHLLPLERTKDGFEAVASRQGLKVVIGIGG
jgi:L-iditol 2-dehydrogenase